MKSFGRVFAVFSLITVLPFSGKVFADTSALEQRLDALEQQVDALKQQLQQQQAVPQGANSTTSQTPPAPIITADSKNGFSVKSPDGDYSLKIGGYVQADAREFASTDKKELGEVSSIIPRRVRLIIQGTVAKDFDYFIDPDFGYNNNFSSISNATAGTASAYAPSLQDAWLDWKYFPAATIKVGKFKTPFDLENLQDTRYTAFTELGLTSNLVPQRDVGAQVGGNLFDDHITYAGGIFDGAADKENGYGGTSTAGADTNNRSGTGRIFVKPFKDTSIEPLQGLGFGYAASYGKEKGSDLPSYITAGQAPIFSYNSTVSAAGPQYREEPQAFYYYKSLGVLAEAVESQEELQYTSGGHVIRTSPDNKAFELTSTYVLTGENASYNGVTPKHDFDPSAGNWGAFELAVRYGELKLDHSIFDDGFASLNTSVSEERAWATGINWYLNRNVKLVFDFEQTKFRRGAVAGVNGGNRKPENLFTGLAQLSF